MIISQRQFIYVGGGLLIVGMLGSALFLFSDEPPLRVGDDRDQVTTEIITYSPPIDNDTLLADDRIEDKKPRFDPEIMDRRPLSGWFVNASAAVMRLDVPIIKPDIEAGLLTLYPSYSEAIAKAPGNVLASVNLIDGKAKQFDDGLYAALDQAYYAGNGDALKSHLDLIRRIYMKVESGSPAADYLAGGLIVAGKAPESSSPKARSLAANFLRDQIASKPIAFYTWTPTLSDCFRVLRYFSKAIRDPAIFGEIARALKAEPELLADYRKALAFYAGLSNPLVGLSPASLIDQPAPPANVSVSLFPPSTSRETELFEKLFPAGPPPDANLMRTLITAIRSGKVDLKPGKNGGWYDYQVHALETMLLPERGEESDRLLLTKAYKKRMLAAFEALITKRRETHSRQMKSVEAPGPIHQQELESIAPRLRVEPCPSYYLRTARSYAFLSGFLASSVGDATLKTLHGLRQYGLREKDLHAELTFMRELFYGLYLLSTEDIGMKPAFLADEPVDRDSCEKTASNWLARHRDDPDLAVDTRVGVPVSHDQARNTTRVWLTLGVRLSKLDASYVKGPKIRPETGPGDWADVEPYKLHTLSSLIAVDEFAEVEIPAGKVYNRAELQAICKTHKTKAAIIEALKAH